MIVTRFAPSPNGPLHWGHAYSAIVAHDLAAQATAPAVEVTVRIRPGKVQPLCHAGVFDVAFHQLVAEFNGGVLTVFFVAGADFGTLLRGHSGMVVKGIPAVLT